jgi:chromosomal replication initiator protein
VNPQETWKTAYHQLELQLERPTFETWLKGAALLSVEDGVFVVGVGNIYARDMLQLRLYRTIRRAVSEAAGENVELRFEVCQNLPEPEAETEEEMPLFRLLAQQEPVEAAVPLHKQIARPQRAELPESELNPKYTFDRFIAASENATIFAAAQSVAERPASAYNPFFIYGGVGLGKTHLLQAIAHACKARNLRVIYVPSEAFTNDLVDAIRNRSTAMFRERYRSVDVLIVDDVQFISGKESTQEEFFHTFNTLYTYNKQIVLASDRHPRELQTLEARLRSRFEGGLVMDIQPPTLETRIAILNNWAREREIKLSRHVVEMLAERAKSNVRELEGVFNHVVATAYHTGHTVTMDTAVEIVDGFHRPRHQITLTQVLETTARHFGLRPDDLTGPKRSGAINTARQVAMYLSRDLTNASLPQIGDAFGGRTHSTVLHSCSKITADLGDNPALQTIVKDIKGRLLKG